MDNHRRRVNYVVQNLGMTREAAETYVTGSYALGLDLNLKPGQARRIRHGRAADGAHRTAQRRAAAQTAQRLRAHWGPAYGRSWAPAGRGTSVAAVAVDEISTFLGGTAAAPEQARKPRLFRRKSG